ncbi:NAD(P)/FAD-dependent oxidoreductase [Methylophilus sp. 14]|uniref:NAD(P)/FAD-dependent oxidoreductase n=1 Tax=Methylophilus sp. 14 TaxID=2781019 RepID=UPI00188F0EF0|nr:NAD(P)/FAD-dependent oxidoreductase [Methylophilus sp. 14]MBF4987746.1 NAD(P)/FAD-dependent oxidoreductase [Methylophilus sp. 14]
MLRITEIKLPIALADTLKHQDDQIRAAILKRLEIPESELISFEIFKRGVDARKSHAILYVYNLDVTVKNEAKLLARFKKDPHVKPAPDTNYHFVATQPNTLQTGSAARPVVVGFGPAGIFAALILAQAGFKPIVLERGKEVRKRTKDTWGLWRKRELNPESNVQFGEGGAGTFSDGKLYSQIKDTKHYSRKVLQEFVKAGAPEEILYVSHPHIGTFRLVGMVEDMRNTIISLGGEIRFESRVTDIAIEHQQVQGVTLHTGEFIATQHLVLAVGHSARDTFEMVHAKGIYVEAKPFSIGFRIEHPQSLIDRARYGKSYSDDILQKLGAADYKLVHHASNGRSVYSFCMCPGGTVVAAASEPNRVVTNGMSQYSRNERNANAGIVVGITPEVDYPGHPLAGVEFQRQLESQAYVVGGSNYSAPGQLIGDFLANRPSTQFGEVTPSYTPGVHLTNLDSVLPEFAISAIREAIPAFAKQVPGFDLADGVLTGVETRTSSPIRIKRDDDTLQSINTKGLFPCGEGAGYAGGILSAAVDGIKVAEAVSLSLTSI